MELRSKRIKSMIGAMSDLSTLSNPINKSIKPTQIYNDYFDDISSVKQVQYNSFTPVIPKKQNPGNNSEVKSCNYNYHCINASINYSNKSTISTANSGRSNILTPSPIRTSAREVISRRPLKRLTDKSSMFSYIYS